jgi:hypothetical protein
MLAGDHSDFSTAVYTAAYYYAAAARPPKKLPPLVVLAPALFAFRRLFTFFNTLIVILYASCVI